MRLELLCAGAVCVLKSDALLSTYCGSERHSLPQMKDEIVPALNTA